jgi:hypothetical protein
MRVGEMPTAARGRWSPGNEVPHQSLAERRQSTAPMWQNLHRVVIEIQQDPRQSVVPPRRFVVRAAAAALEPAARPLPSLRDASPVADSHKRAVVGLHAVEKFTARSSTALGLQSGVARVVAPTASRHRRVARLAGKVSPAAAVHADKVGGKLRGLPQPLVAVRVGSTMPALRFPGVWFLPASRRREGTPFGLQVCEAHSTARCVGLRLHRKGARPVAAVVDGSPPLFRQRRSARCVLNRQPPSAC